MDLLLLLLRRRLHQRDSLKKKPRKRNHRPKIVFGVVWLYGQRTNKRAIDITPFVWIMCVNMTFSCWRLTKTFVEERGAFKFNGKRNLLIFFNTIANRRCDETDAGYRYEANVHCTMWMCLKMVLCICDDLEMHPSTLPFVIHPKQRAATTVTFNWNSSKWGCALVRNAHLVLGYVRIPSSLNRREGNKMFLHSIFSEWCPKEEKWNLWKHTHARHSPFDKLLFTEK